jgi:hypothetical protein
VTVTIFIWMPKASLDRKQRSVGHASLHLGTKKQYISFWPENDSVKRAVGHNMGADRKYECGNLPDYASAPIACLDEEAISAYWKQVKVGSRTAPYQGGQAKMESREDADSYEIFGKNCSKVVMDCLIAGGALKNNRVTTLYSEGATITPIDIRQIAEILAGERGEVGGASFPIADVLIDKALNATGHVANYGAYIPSALVGAVVDSLKPSR